MTHQGNSLEDRQIQQERQKVSLGGSVRMPGLAGGFPCEIYGISARDDYIGGAAAAKKRDGDGL
jgi:hypothetical protein